MTWTSKDQMLCKVGLRNWKSSIKVWSKIEFPFQLRSYQLSSTQNEMLYFLFLRMLFLCSLNANRSFCSNCIIHALIKYSWAIPSIHKFTWIFSTILFSFHFFSTQDATQGNIRFNRAGNQHSISYASNGKLNWLNHFSPHMSNQIIIVTLRISLWNYQMYFNFITVILCAFIRLNRPGQ